MRLDLHIGLPQTGTTALQSFFSANAVPLAQAGLLYPQTGRLNNAHYMLSFALGLGRYDEGPVETPEVLRDKLKQEIGQFSGDRVLLSSEYFVLAGPADIARLRQMFAEYDMRILVYLRRHDRALEAAYGQSVKTTAPPPWRPTIESFSLFQLMNNLQQYDYLALLRRWSAVFGKAAIVVRPYERSQNTPDLFADVLKTIGIADSVAFARPGILNPTLDRRFLAAIGTVNRTAIPETTKQLLTGALIQLGSRQVAGEPHLAPAMRRALVNRFRPSYRVIANEFMASGDGVLFREPLADDASNPEQLPEIGSDTILELILKAAALYLH